MTTREYFEKRALETEYHSKQRGEKYLKDLKKSYEQTKQYLKKDIKSFYKKYADELEQISNIDATKALTHEELVKYFELVKEKINKSSMSELEKKLHRQKYLISRLNRYEALLKQIELNLDLLTTDYEQSATEHLSENYKQCYSEAAHTMYNSPRSDFTLSFTAFNNTAIETIVKTKWSNKSFCERIWGHNKNTIKEVRNILNVGISLGYSVEKMTKQVMQRLDVNYSNAKRLVRTESNYVMSEATSDLYKDVGLEKYRYLAVLDYKTSLICQRLDRKIFFVKERQVGLNCNPMHPNCRSTTVPYLPEYEDEENETRLARGVDGKTYKVPANYDYKKWYESMSDEQKQKHHVAHKSHQNKQMDKRQYERYKQVIPKQNLPKTLAEYQKMKYTETHKYDLFKIDYARRSKLIKNPLLRLPNADKAYIDDRKFTNYLFGGENERGLAKGRLITRKLGYDINNYFDFKKEILNRAKSYPSRFIIADENGRKYETRAIFYDKKNNPVNLEIGWQVKGEDTHMTSIYVTEVKKNET